MASFKIGINMAGAISAGAYTAGVLDFMTEALDEWYAAKARGEAVPRHDVTIEVFSGASAGGMCAAISSVMLQEDFEHIHDATRVGTTNRFYESWVNRIDITELLKTQDMDRGEAVHSLLDSTIIQNIASYALTPDAPRGVPRAYVSPKLTLFLSLTNLRGVPYSLNSVAPGSLEESTFFYGDRIRFEVSGTSSGSLPVGAVRYLNHSRTGAEGGWDVLQSAAMATGAFPLFLAPRALFRYKGEYCPPHWESVTSAAVGTPPPVAPAFPANFPEPFPTLNVDGGVTNNDPFNYAHDFLVSLDPVPQPGQNLSKPLEADRAVITIAPFPPTELIEPVFDPSAKASIFWALPRLFSALISQSRFFGEALSGVMSGETFSRFVIAPSDSELTKEHLKKGGSLADQPPALQCASMGAFGGFFERGFRAHDYELGRRNCQKFLKDSFVLPFDNPVIASGLSKLDGGVKKAVETQFGRQAPGSYVDDAVPPLQQEAGNFWMPIIPLCTTALSDRMPRVERAKISSSKLDLIIDLIIGRYRAVIRNLIRLIPSCGFRIFLTAGQPVIRWMMRGVVRDALVKQLGDEVGK
jgi:hypothetical protein